jgi:hypothetical protein
MRYESDGTPLRNVSFSVAVNTMLGRLMLNLDSTLTAKDFAVTEDGGQVRCQIPSLPLAAGSYQITLYAYTGGEVLDLVDRAAPLNVVGGVNAAGSGLALSPNVQGVLIDYDWSAA